MSGNPLLDRILMAINLLGILGCLGVFIYTDYIYKRPLPNDQLEFQLFKDQSQAQSIVQSFPLDKMIINLHSSNSRLRFLDVQIHLLPYLEKQSKIMEANKPLIHDAIIHLVGKMEPNEINTLAGKILLENRLKKEINRQLGQMVVKKIFFTTFVVQ